MIFAVTGHIGGGKTLLLVHDILERLARGGRVWTNIVLHVDKCSQYCKAVYGRVPDWESQFTLLPDTFDDKALIELLEDCSDIEAGGMLVIDEVAEYWASSEKSAKDLSRSITRLLRQSRKIKLDVYLVGQDFNQLQASLRRLVQRQTDTRDMKLFTAWGIPFGAITPWRFFHRQRIIDSVSGREVNIRWWRKDVRLYDCYNTRQFLGGSIVGGGSASVNRPRRISRRVSIRLVLVALHGLMIFSVFSSALILRPQKPLSPVPPSPPAPVYLSVRPWQVKNNGVYLFGYSVTNDLPNFLRGTFVEEFGTVLEVDEYFIEFRRKDGGLLYLLPCVSSTAPVFYPSTPLKESRK